MPDGNHLDIADTTSVRLAFDQGTLLLNGVSRIFIERLWPVDLWTFDARGRNNTDGLGDHDPANALHQWRTDAVHYRRIRADLDHSLAAQSWIDEVPQWHEVRYRRCELHPPRPDQQDAIDAWSDRRRGVIVMPTGTGKTEVALRAMASCQCATLIVSPVRDLMYQWHTRILAATRIDAGIIGDGVHRVSPLSVTTYDSAAIHMPRLGNQFQLIIFDECHHLPGAMRQDAARMSAAPFRMGLTATPERRDGNHTLLDDLIGPRVYTQAIASARGRTLAKYDIHRISVHLSEQERYRYEALSRRVGDYLAERRKDEPNYDWQTLCRESGRDPGARAAMQAFHAKRSIEDRAEEKLRIIEDLFRLHAGEPVIVFCGSNAMARDVSTRFLIPCLLSHCRKRERQEILEGLRAGRYPALVANRVLDEGVDLPEVNVAIVIGGGSGTRQAVQRLGRVLRKNAFGRACFYEIVTAGTRDEQRSRDRRRDDAFHKQ
ncbi:DEAD/DEAH box helicase [Allorhodopirellula heiligendammensis]|uniref:UvrABC system protein B n=1 Tax=Allorhodopirellula heiligendammensis TaxID=2714739 RepID=A0A5C6BG82_9BACT|nr:DEAD/DEAH box helicase [Allorhodopirellula heiligendammensis]TWU10501.1 UvrABC system protein B [Allorhodopirellula heiligendammensis]